MSKERTHRWSEGGIFDKILKAMEAEGLDPSTVTVEDLAPLDHFHARGFPATVELGDAMPVLADHHLLDIGCGIGGPARYFAKRFGCRVTGIDITQDFVDAARRLTRMVGLEDKVDLRLGDANRLEFPDGMFDGAYAQHVTMNIPDRMAFFTEVSRVIRSGGFFALSEHGLGPTGAPYFPVPWSEDGAGSHLVKPDVTVRFLADAGFADIQVVATGSKYLAGYRRAIELAEAGKLPSFGVHILMGETAPAKTLNAARNIEEGRTHPIQIMCVKA